MSIWDGIALVGIGVAVGILWSDWSRRRVDLAASKARHPAQKAALARMLAGCDCGQWDQPTDEPWSHTAERCQPMREAMRGFDR